MPPRIAPFKMKEPGELASDMATIGRLTDVTYPGD
jgi:hypothetical protein